MQLRPYQTHAVHALRVSLSARKRRIILYSPTGSGKTELGIEMIKGAQAKGKRVLFVCDRINLVMQTSRRFTKADVLHGIIQGSNSVWTTSDILVCSIQTLVKRGIPETVDLLIIDEAHKATSEQYKKLLFAAKCPVIGLTATPFSRGLGKHHDEIGGPLFEEIIAATTIQELIEQGFLVDVDIYAPSEPDLKGVKITAGDYNEKQLGQRVDTKQLVGDIVENWKKLAGGRRTVVFATNIAHSQHIVDEFRKAGVRAEHMDCFTGDDERQRILWAMEAGDIDVISNVSILAEGWDCPSVEVMILARPTRSLIRYIQMVGRVLRPAEGKTKALMIDHSGSCRRLGFPTDDLPLELCDGTKKEPGKADEDEEAHIEQKPQACPQCHYLKPIGVSVCPRCGHEHKRKNKVVMTKGDLEMLRRAKPEVKRDVYAQLLSLQRGKSNGWVAHKYRKYFGVWPVGMSGIKPIPASRAVIDFVRSENIAYAKSLAVKDAPPAPTHSVTGWKEEAVAM